MQLDKEQKRVLGAGIIVTLIMTLFYVLGSKILKKDE